jgi:hypothetical protein
MPEAFRTAMREVYRNDFGQNVTHFRGQLHYFNKFAYTDRSVIVPFNCRKEKADPCPVTLANVLCTRLEISYAPGI